MENLAIWDKVKDPPAAAMKEIKGGRLSGKTDINPQWRYQVMTEIYGPCGIGWRYSIDKLWLEPGTAGEVMAFAQISLYITVEGEWAAPIPGIGGSMAIAKETAGLHTSDEAYKMAVTDALSVAMKMLGVGASVYLGMMDGSKYNKKLQPPPKTTPEAATTPQVKKMYAMLKSTDFNTTEQEEFKKWLKAHDKVQTVDDKGKTTITKKGASHIFDNFDTLKSDWIDSKMTEEPPPQDDDVPY